MTVLSVRKEVQSLCISTVFLSMSISLTSVLSAPSVSLTTAQPDPPSELPSSLSDSSSSSSSISPSRLRELLQALNIKPGVFTDDEIERLAAGERLTPGEKKKKSKRQTKSKGIDQDLSKALGKQQHEVENVWMNKILAKNRASKLITNEETKEIIDIKTGNRRAAEWTERQRDKKYTYVAEGGEMILYRNAEIGKGKDGKRREYDRRRVVTCEDLFSTLRKHHDLESNFGIRHIGWKKSYLILQDHYYGIDQDVLRTYIRHCETCAARSSIKAGTVLKQIESHQTHERWQMDLVDLRKHSVCENEEKIEELGKRLKETTDPTQRLILFEMMRQLKEDTEKLVESRTKTTFRYIMCVKDHFSRFCWLFPLARKTARAVADTLRLIFVLFGAPKRLQSDNGGEFIGPEVSELCEEFKVLQVHGTAYHSQSQGSVEQLNRTVEDRLVNMLPKRNDVPLYGMWPLLLPEVLKSINFTHSSATKFTPYRLMFHAKAPVNTKIASTDLQEDLDKRRAEMEIELEQKDSELQAAAAAQQQEEAKQLSAASVQNVREEEKGGDNAAAETVSEPQEDQGRMETEEKKAQSSLEFQNDNSMDTEETQAEQQDLVGVELSPLMQPQTAQPQPDLLLQPLSPTRLQQAETTITETFEVKYNGDIQNRNPLELQAQPKKKAKRAIQKRKKSNADQVSDTAVSESQSVVELLSESDEESEEKKNQEKERKQADENAAASRSEIQARYSSAAVKFKEGDHCNVFLLHNYLGKLDQKVVPAVVVKVFHDHLYSVFTEYGLLTDKFNGSQLGILRARPEKLFTAYETQKKDWRRVKKLSLIDLSKLRGSGSFRCACGKKRKDPNDPITCGANCKCSKNKTHCGSECHKGGHCNNKADRSSQRLTA